MATRALSSGELRVQAIRHTLFPETTLRRAIERLSFVQADPIRAPARAQDLILRLRVKGYRAGDLERHYPALNIEEGLFYAYGFMTRPLWQLRHPQDAARLSRFETALLDSVRRLGAAHPAELARELGRKRAVNAWGGYSTVAKLGLERLHQRGLVRVVRRDKGIRVYAASPPEPAPPPPGETLRRLALAVSQVLAPISERMLRGRLSRFARSLRRAPSAPAIIAACLRAGELEHEVIDGVRYLWPASLGKPARAGGRRDDVAPLVRLLAPFDPLVWDRERFEHLFGWSYRFEAYTPMAKRVRGYYALPLLWRDDIIGWGNVGVVDERLEADFGFVGGRPRERSFAVELEAELERLRVFLKLPNAQR
jgi:uncharacterized protein YcaQ